MQTFNYLPGIIVNTEDGGLAASYTPSDDAVLVLGIAGDGVVNTPYQVTNLGVAAQQFGPNGSLFRGIAEASTYSDNVIGYRIGTTPMSLAGVGEETAGTITAGFGISFSAVTADADAESCGDGTGSFFARSEEHT